MSRYLPIEEALEGLAKVANIGVKHEQVPLLEAVGRICAKSYESPIDIPPWDASAVDGYAVRSRDVSSASPTNPAELRLVERDEIHRGEAKRVFTGDPLPKGADAVVMEEYCEVLGGTLFVYRAVSPWHNVRRRGEDLAKGRRIIERGRIVRPWHIAALAAIGVSEVEVFEKLRVGIVVVGSEVVEPSEGPRAYGGGRVLNSTGYMVYATLAEYRFVEPVYLGIVPDDPNAIASAIERALENCHAIITCGGTGPSARDVTPKSVEILKGEIIARGLSMRPGRPTSIAIIAGKPIYMLSGFPVAAFLAVRYVVIPSLMKILGAHPRELRVPAKLSSRVASDPNYVNFVRAKLRLVGDELVTEPIAIKGSGNISSLLEADGIVVVPRGVEGFDRGAYVLLDIL